MSKNEFPYKHPLSAQDLLEIRMKAHKERNEALAQMARSAAAAFARLLPRLSREPASPTPPFSTMSR